MVSMRVSRNGGGRCAGQARSVQLNSSLPASSEAAGAVSTESKKGSNHRSEAETVPVPTIVEG